MTCQCISPDCPVHRPELACSFEATRRVRSRDWDEGDYAMCRTCGTSAVTSGIFEEAN